MCNGKLANTVFTLNEKRRDIFIFVMIPFFIYLMSHIQERYHLSGISCGFEESEVGWGGRADRPDQWPGRAPSTATGLPLREADPSDYLISLARGQA